MECKKVQDRLMTEYLDKELPAEDRSGIEQHLAECAACREFLGTVQKTAVIPFKEAGEMQPDGIVWERIAAKLEGRRDLLGSGFGGWLDKIASWRPLPIMRGAFVTALILVVVMVAKFPFTYTDPVYGYMSEQMAFMSELGTGNTDLLNGDLKEYDTVFEEIAK